MGGRKKELENKSTARSSEAVAAEGKGAAALSGELNQRRAMVGNGLPQTLQATQAGAANLRTTGGVTPMDIDTTGRGYEGYQELAKTGGFTPGESENFLRRASAPAQAAYGASKDELSRRTALQGGYMPGFGASEARLTRQAANTGAETALSGNLELNKQVREGKLAGLAGQERVKTQAEAERLAKQGQIQQGQIAGQSALQNYSQFGIAALSDTDVNDLRNRLQSGNMSQQDAQLLAQLSAQHPDKFSQIMQGVKTIGGATAGVLGAL